MTSFEPFKVLNVDDLGEIKRGQQVFLTTWLTVTCAEKDNSGEAIGIVTQIYPNELEDEDEVIPIIKSL